jgi:hypothetical protein
VGTRREKTVIGWKERKESAECAIRRESQLSNLAVEEWIQRGKNWMKEIWKRSERIKKERGGNRKKMLIFV